MKIIIHIGWHKTGTTSIQFFLKRNKKKLIDESNLYYPSEGLLENSHHNIPFALKGKDKSPWSNLPSNDVKILIQQAIKNGKKLGCTKLIFSSEEFCTLSEKEIINLSEILNYENNKVIIVAYIRRQDLMIESAYNTEVKWWGSRFTDGFQQYVKNKSPYINFDSVLNSWANVFGLENIKVRLFCPSQMPEGDVRLDFCRVIGIDFNSFEFDHKKINSSLGPKGLALLRITNKISIPRKLHELIVSILQRLEKSSKCVLFEPEQRIEFMENLNFSNKKLEKFSINPDLLILEKDIVTGQNEKSKH